MFISFSLWWYQLLKVVSQQVYTNVLYATCSVTPGLLMAAAIVVTVIMLSKNVPVRYVAIASKAVMTSAVT